MSVFYQQKPSDFSSSLEVSTIFIEAENKIFFLQRGKGKVCPEEWAVPGGKLEEGETPLQGLKREIWEELQIDVNPDEIEYVDSFYVRHPLCDYKLHLFYWLVSAPFDVTLCPEHQDFKWHPKERCHDLKLIEGQYEAFLRVFKNKE